MDEAAWFKILLVVGAVLAALGLLGLVQRSMHRARNSTSSMRAGAWALMFLFSGRMPPPPPETQIEAERQTEKDRSVGRDVES